MYGVWYGEEYYNYESCGDTQSFEALRYVGLEPCEDSYTEDWAWKILHGEI